MDLLEKFNVENHFILRVSKSLNFLGECCLINAYWYNNAIEEAREKIVSNKISDSDMKSRAKILKAIIQELFLNLGIDLKG